MICRVTHCQLKESDPASFDCVGCQTKVRSIHYIQFQTAELWLCDKCYKVLIKKLMKGGDDV